MKFAVCLLVMLPMVLCASIEERFIFGSFQINGLGDATKLLQSALGSDATEAQCEAACPGIVGTVLSLLCGPACKELQHLAQGK